VLTRGRLAAHGFDPEVAVAETAPVVLVEVEDRLATVTLNRPEARNALSRALTYALWDAVLAAGADPDVDAVILTGTDPAFSAGVDLKELTGELPPTAEARGPGEGPERAGNGLYRFLPVIPKPIIGAINGVAVTGGLELALQCTFLVASERARFADTHARVGVMPGGGITVLLAQSIGLRRAIEMSLTGNFVSADEALSLGLVNHVVPHDELLDFSRRLAADMATTDSDALAAIFATYDQGALVAGREAGQIEARAHARWHSGGIDAGQVASRREAVIKRGRSQR
jgi:enoyl-CoA hydratase/carnithine racemase